MERTNWAATTLVARMDPRGAFRNAWLEARALGGDH